MTTLALKPNLLGKAQAARLLTPDALLPQMGTCHQSWRQASDGG